MKQNKPLIPRYKQQQQVIKANFNATNNFGLSTNMIIIKHLLYSLIFRMADELNKNDDKMVQINQLIDKIEASNLQYLTEFKELFKNNGDSDNHSLIYNDEYKLGRFHFIASELSESNTCTELYNYLNYLRSFQSKENLERVTKKKAKIIKKGAPRINSRIAPLIYFSKYIASKKESDQLLIKIGEMLSINGLIHKAVDKIYGKGMYFRLNIPTTNNEPDAKGNVSKLWVRPHIKTYNRTAQELFFKRFYKVINRDPNYNDKLRKRLLGEQEIEKFTPPLASVDDVDTKLISKFIKTRKDLTHWLLGYSPRPLPDEESCAFYDWIDYEILLKKDFYFVSKLDTIALDEQTKRVTKNRRKKKGNTE